MTLQSGDVIFVRGSSLLSKLIRYFDGGEFTHVAIVIDDKHVLDSQYPLGVRIRHFRFADYEAVRLPIDVETAKKYIGYKYDFKQFFWYAFRVGKIWNTPNQFICSELVAHTVGREDWLELTPNELYKKITE